jgi:ubiquitin thioesterase OTU1
MIVKVQSSNFTEKHQIPDNITLLEFKRLINEKTQIPVYEMEFLIGFPPKLLTEGKSNQFVSELGITSGSCVTVRRSSTKQSYLLKLQEMGYSDPAIMSTLESFELLPFEEVVELCDKSPLNKGIYHLLIERVSIPADNSCLFNSIRYLLNLKENSQALREVVAGVIESDPSTYNEEFLDKKPSDYKKWILNQDHWGGEIEISILSNIFEVVIVVFDIRSNISLSYGEDKGYTKKILLLFDGIHYDALVEKDKKTGHRILSFDVHNMAIVETCKQLVKELQEKKQFVNLATGQLFCNDCYCVLKGENEAVEHAKVTGHTNFAQK